MKKSMSSGNNNKMDEDFLSKEIDTNEVIELVNEEKVIKPPQIDGNNKN